VGPTYTTCLNNEKTLHFPRDVCLCIFLRFSGIIPLQKLIVDICNGDAVNFETLFRKISDLNVLKEFAFNLVKLKDPKVLNSNIRLWQIEAIYAENVHVLSFPVQNISWFKLRKFDNSLIYAKPYWTERQEPIINCYIVVNKIENVSKT
jgi:hypothetical protein